MECQSSCQTTIKYLCKEIIDIRKDFIGLKELCFDIINTKNVQPKKDTSETMKDNVVLNNINVINNLSDYNLMENYSKATTIAATVEEPSKRKNESSNFDLKPTEKNLGHEDKPDNVLFLQKILENQVAIQKEIQDIKTDLKKQEETCVKLQEDTQCFLQSAGTLQEIETIKAGLRKLEGTCFNRKEDNFQTIMALLVEIASLNTDLEKLNKTCDKRQEDTQLFRQSAASLEEKIGSIGADLKKLEEACDDREEDSQTFRRSVATLNEIEIVKADLEKLNKTCDKMQEESQHFRQSTASLEENIKSFGADLNKLEGACETRQKCTDNHVKTIDTKIAQISAKTQTASSDGNGKPKAYTGKEDFRKKLDSSEIAIVESVLKIYPESFFHFHPNCLNFDYSCCQLLWLNTWLDKVQNLDITRINYYKEYGNLLLYNFDKIMAYYEENFGSYKNYTSYSC